MEPDPAQDPRRPEERTENERLAALVSADREAILESYAQALNAIQSPLVGESHTFSQALEHASEILSDVVASTRAGNVRIDDRYALLARTIGESRAQSHISPSDSVRAAVALFEVTLSALASHVIGDTDLLPGLLVATLALNESLSSRVREGTLAYTGYLLEHIHQGHLHERRRIARDLHDRLGERLSVAFRQLELQEISRERDAAVTASHSALARQALADAMRVLRLMISDLRQDSVTNLEKALTQYIHSLAADANVQLRVSGDETWVPPAVVDEAFLIIREAIRNALAHGAASSILIRIALAPNQLRALIDDDGRGFVLGTEADSPSAGLASMRERTALLGGWLTLSSEAGQGTHVELVVPLPGHRDHVSDVSPSSGA